MLILLYSFYLLLEKTCPMYFDFNTGICCDTLGIMAETQTDLDKIIPGKYQYYRDYQGYPSYKKKTNDDDSSSLPLFLFYNENRWVMEPKLGSITSGSGKELWGMVRYNGSYVCPEDVGKGWMYYSDSSGIVNEVDETIIVACGNKYV